MSLRKKKMGKTNENKKSRMEMIGNTNRKDWS